jgi:hypothetical protein
VAYIANAVSKYFTMNLIVVYFGFCKSKYF